MKNINRLILIATFIFPIIAQALNVTQVHVDAGEVGQGFLLKRLNNCFLVTPEHVLGDEFFSSVITGTSKRSLGEAERLQVFGYDLSLSEVTGAAQKECVTAINSFEPIDDLLKTVTSLSVSSINADGSKSLTPVSLTDAGLVNLIVKPTSDMPLYKGLSGSLVFYNDTPVGMLQSVDSDTGEGSVLRIDRTIETIKPFFTTAISQPNAENASASPENNTINYTVTEWSHPPLDSSYRVAHLFDQNPQTSWAVKPDGKKIRLLLDFNKELKVVNSLNFMAVIADKTSIPKDIQIMSTRRAEGSRGWTTIYSGTWLNTKTEFEALFAPIKAKRIKVIVSSNWGNTQKIGLTELLVR